MMTIPSIDMAAGNLIPAGGNPVDVTPDALLAPLADVPTETVRPQAKTPQGVVDISTESSGLAELVRENAALGEALRALVDDFDRPVAKRRVETALPQVAELEAPVAIEKPEAAKPEVPVTVDKPIEHSIEGLVERPIERPVVTVPETTVAIDKPIVSDPKVVVAIDKPEVVAKPETPLTVVEDQPRIVRPRDVEPIESDEVVAPVVLDRAPAVESVVAAPSPQVEANVAVASPETVERVVRVSELMGLASAEPVAAAVPSDQLVAAANEVASFILVTPSLMHGEAGEIRVQLRPDVLAGSEVVIAVDGRKMEVTFVPQTTAVADAVVTHTPQIVETLTTRVEGFQFAVDVAQTVATNVAAAAQVAESSYRAPTRRSYGRA